MGTRHLFLPRQRRSSHWVTKGQATRNSRVCGDAGSGHEDSAWRGTERCGESGAPPKALSAAVPFVPIVLLGSHRIAPLLSGTGHGDRIAGGHVPRTCPCCLPHGHLLLSC